MAAEIIRNRDSQPGYEQNPSQAEGRPGFRVLVIFKGSQAFVPHEERPGFFRRLTPQPSTSEVAPINPKPSIK